MNKEQFRNLVEGLDLEDLYWSEKLSEKFFITPRQIDSN